MEQYLLQKLHERGFSHAYYLPEVDSTNRALRLLAEEGAPEGTVVFAGKQTAGYGRFGRPFFSPRGTGLYGSVLLRPPAGADPAKITLSAAVAVAEAVEQVLGISLSVKWVNDLYYRGKKVAGILAQSATHGTESFCILGVGLNVFTPQEGFGELSSIAGALLEQDPDPQILATLAAAMVEEFFRRYKGDFALCLDAYRARSFLTGKQVTIAQGDNRFCGKVLGIDDCGALLVETSQGVRAFGSGEIALEDYR